MNIYLLYLLVIVSCGFSAFASYFFKGASGKINGLNVTILLKEKTFWLGCFLYLVSAVFTIYLLRFLDYSIILPLGSVTYIWTMFIASLLLKEKITKRKVFGVCAIAVGAVLISIG